MTGTRGRRPFHALHALATAALAWALVPALAAAAPDAGTPPPPPGPPPAAAPAAPPAAPPSTNPHLAPTLSLFEQGQLKAADAKLREALSFEPNTPADKVQLQVLDGMLRGVSLDDDLARAAFARALTLNPEVTLPKAATTRVRRLFEEARAELKARSEPRRSIATQVAKLSVEGKLEGAEALLAEASARKNITQAESGQLLVLKGLTLVLKGLKSAGPTDADKARAAQKAEKELKAVEAQLATTAGGSLTEQESSQQLVLKGLMLVVKGLVKAETGDETQAKAAFAQALDLDPNAKVPALGTAKSQKVFEATKAALPPEPPEAKSTGLSTQVSQLYADGKLERAELLLAQTGERPDLSKAETGQLYALRGLLLVLKGLQKAGANDEQRVKVALGSEGQIKAVEEQIASAGSGSLTPAEAAQQKVLSGLLLVVKGLVKAETGDEAQAQAAFAQALEMNPDVKLPTLAKAKAQQLFDTTRSTSPTQWYPAQVERFYADGQIDRASALLEEARARKDLTPAESGQLLVLDGLHLVLQGLKKAGGSKEERSEASRQAQSELARVEGRLTSLDGAAVSDTERAQQRLLKGLVQMVKGLALAESGDESRAKEAFAQALKLNPKARFPAVGTAKTSQLFESTRAKATAASAPSVSASGKRPYLLVPPIIGNRPADAVLLGAPASLLGGVISWNISAAWCQCLGRPEPPAETQLLSVQTAGGLGIGIGAWLAIAQGQMDRGWPAQVGALLAIPAGVLSGAAVYWLEGSGVRFPWGWAIVGAVPLAVGVVGSEVAAAVVPEPEPARPPARGTTTALRWQVIPGWSPATGSASLQVVGSF